MNAAAAQDQTIVIEREFAHPPEKVWRALTQGALMEEWLLANDFEPVVGRRFTLRADPIPGKWDGLVAGEVLEVEPQKKLAYTWDVGPDGPHALRTVVTYTLTPTQGGTKLRMEHAGFRAGQEQNAKGAQYGWGMFLGKLEGVVAKA